MGLPGVKIGPLDPDVTADFGQVSATNSARTLIRLHTQAHPPELVRALARPLDAERTKALVMDEVRGYLSGLKLDNGDPVLPDGAKVVGAQVRGDRDREQTLTFTYETSSGRTAKWHAPYDVEELPDSAEAGDDLVQAKELRDRGLVAWDSEGTSAEILRRQAAGLRRERDALRDRLSKASAKDIEETDTDVRPDVQIVAENEQVRRENEELRARVAQLETLAERAGQESLRPDGAGDTEDTEREGAGDTVASEDPPFEGYDAVNAKDLIARIRSEDTSSEERQAILDYERSHNNRRGVVGAAEQALGRT